MVKIGLDDSMQTALMKMSGGNPGALSIVMQMMEKSPEIDPQSAMMGGLAPVLMLDTFGIYEDRIWMLAKDVCKHDVVKMLACLRAVQLGHISEDVLNHAIDHYGEGIDLELILSRVKLELNEFDKEEQ